MNKETVPPFTVQPAIDILQARCVELAGDLRTGLGEEYHSRVAGDDALIRAYKLAIAHLLFSSGQLVSIVDTPFQCPKCLWFGGFGYCDGDGDNSGQCPRCGTPCIDIGLAARKESPMKTEQDLNSINFPKTSNPPHLCTTCTKEFPTCDGDGIVFGIDRDPTAKGADADRVLVCRGFTTIHLPKNREWPDGLVVELDRDRKLDQCAALFKWASIVVGVVLVGLVLWWCIFATYPTATSP